MGGLIPFSYTKENVINWGNLKEVIPNTKDSTDQYTKNIPSAKNGAKDFFLDCFSKDEH